MLVDLHAYDMYDLIVFFVGVDSRRYPLDRTASISRCVTARSGVGNEGTPQSALEDAG